MFRTAPLGRESAMPVGVAQMELFSPLRGYLGLLQGTIMDASDNDRGLAERAGSAGLLACFATTEDSNKMTGPSAAPAKRRVLVVEDEMLIGMLLEDMLTDLGHEVAAIVPRLKEAMAAVDRET